MKKRSCLYHPLIVYGDLVQRVGSYDKVLRQTLLLAPSLSLSSSHEWIWRHIDMLFDDDTLGWWGWRS